MACSPLTDADRDQPRRAAFDALRVSMRRLEGSWREARPVWPLGLPAIDSVLPGGGLRRDAVHEIIAGEADMAAARGFLAMVLARDLQVGPMLWCAPETELYGAALARLGLSPERLVLVCARRLNDLLWAMEEGLRTRGLAAVIGEPAELDLTASRRLQLAAQETGITCFVLRRRHGAANAAMTRWQVTPAPGLVHGSTGLDDFGPMRARWRVRLLRCRGAMPQGEAGYGSWLVTEGDRAHPAEAELETSYDEAASARKNSSDAGLSGSTQAA